MERGDEAVVKRLTEEGKGPEERVQGLTPLMKAAEGDKVVIMAHLVARNISLECENRKGRTALSFAAAPSMKRPTALNALRFLLERGANVNHTDANGDTAKDRARKEEREDAVRMLEEAERHGRQRSRSRGRERKDGGKGGDRRTPRGQTPRGQGSRGQTPQASGSRSKEDIKAEQRAVIKRVIELRKQFDEVDRFDQKTDGGTDEGVRDGLQPVPQDAAGCKGL